MASAFEGPFHLDVVASVAEMVEDDALDALDALDRVLEVQVLQPTAAADVYAFVNAVMRHTVYGELSPSRQVRLHRKVAEALEAAYGDELTPTQAGEIASQYHRSRGRPGAERGVEPALQAAAHADSTGAHDQAAQFLRVALELLPEADPRRPRLLARLGTVLAWALSFEEAMQAATEAAEAITGAEGADEAADYLAEATYASSAPTSASPWWTVDWPWPACEVTYEVGPAQELPTHLPSAGRPRILNTRASAWTAPSVRSRPASAGPPGSTPSAPPH